MTEDYLDVPGATLFCKVGGTGPVLLMLQGGAGDANGTDDLTDALADRYTVIAYDRRGLSRSVLHDGTPPPTVRTHSDDASHLLAHLTDEPAFVFASSLGAVIGLELITSHPGQVRLLVAHEAAISAFLPEPARCELLVRQSDVDDTFTREGILPAMTKLFALAGGFTDDPGAEVERTAPSGGRAAQHGRNMQFFLAHDAPDAHRYIPDLPALIAARAAIVPAGGALGHDSFPFRCAQALAEQLDRPLTEFPGGHAGYMLRPRAFAYTLHRTLTSGGLTAGEPAYDTGILSGKIGQVTATDVDALVIFGATGDLAKLETFPALVGLVERGVLTVPVIGVAKSGWGLEQFKDYAASSLTLNNIDPQGAAAVKMLGLLRYIDGDLGDPATYQAMSDAIGDGKRVLFYLEVPPALFGRIAEGIAKAGRADGNRVMVEKPFGYDLASAQQLNETMHAYFPEDSIYRVDHWLGLEPVESLMIVRFANSIIEPLLNRTHVQSIQITMAEAFDVADRGSFYDKTGAIRDVIQNHMLQVLATVLAEPPDGTGLDSWRVAKSQLIGALRPLSPETVVKGQYEGYLGVAGVAPQSTTETYAAISLAADSWRWDGVPILIRAGKCLPVTATEVSVKFRRPPYNAFGISDVDNSLRFRINPENKVTLTLAGKKPGAGWQPESQELTFAEHPGADMRPYDRLIGAALSGERWLFAAQDTVEAAWRVVDPAVGDVVPVHPYARGSWGPDQAAALLPPGEQWHDPA